ncbi:disrupted in renal carcinoma protein 2 homolog isoform X1 [Acanthaster planci]|uniref:Disrupted in renal carcinoma protein 2 homolog isoform X1 n=1 Tax=Acanthaster planci TaxID=133434 RepID=A0A8B7ZBB6_ACAPL|nr:disrupted in renal carcinoma protein 2 homolog isoform X1 [Acanthaster planci]
MAETDPLVSFAAPSDTRLHVHGSKYSTVNQNPQTRSLKKGTDKQEGAQHEAYPARWFILAVFSLLCALQAATWNTWGPIADTVKVVLNWTDSDIALLTNWGPISFVITGFLFSYLLLVKGLRYCVLCSSLIFLLGLGIRCLPVGIDNLKWTMNAGHVCIGIAGPVMMSAPTEVSAVWFPPHQRTTSTAISTTAAFLGMSASFLVGPLIVTSIPQNSSTEPLDPDERTRSFSEIMGLMYIECGVTAVVVVATLLYFPEKPPTSPSLSATRPRDSFKDGALKMIKSAQFWITAAAYSISSGVYGGWSTQQDTIFKTTLDIGQDTVGWIGFISNIAGMLAGLVIARLVDLLGGRMKAVLILLTAGAFIGCVWCVLLSMRYIPYSLMSVYITCIIIGVCVNASPPIFFEITVEGMYPVSEGNTTMVLTYLNNVAALIFLALPLIPNIGVIWMNWLLLGAIAVCIPLLMMYKEHYNRLDEDKMESSIQN